MSCKARKKNTKQNEKRLKNNEDSLRKLWDNINITIFIPEIPQGKETKLGIENMYEKMTENFLNMVREKVTPIQEVRRVLLR